MEPTCASRSDILPMSTCPLKKDFPHVSQLYCLRPVWMSSCRLSEPAVSKPLRQVRQLNGVTSSVVLSRR
ncbi:hypothetical protein EYF80_023729 [Liparis tanakae]|uniref:Uncharacterized protein n=1 Tax=Liparis tanakae TaxID=230148 RepID=A0A4Z2HKJ2_9TELE|nr:hypothetical protein EYF80_023729 [Liparis tanakae]